MEADARQSLSLSSETTNRRFATVDVPQANTLTLVLDLLALVSHGISTKGALAKELRVDPREVDYYRHAARILGFITRPLHDPVITLEGRQLLKAARPSERDALLANAIERTPVMRRLLAALRIEELSKATVREFLRANTRLTGTTLGRRADSILAWLKFISEHDPFDLQSTARLASKQASATYEAYHAVREGPLHRRLKEAVSENPSMHLKEPLALVEVEYQFPTNDRADVLLLDSRDRLVAVEVEVDVGPKDIAGLLQAVKYRHMLAVLYRRQPSRVRGMLVARSLHPAMQERAAIYNIETHEVRDVV